MPIAISPIFIYKSCIFYLVLPIIFFFLGWLKIGIGIILSFLLLLTCNIFLKKISIAATNDKNITLSKEYYISFIILFLFLLSTGNTGFVGCWGTDIPWRNAIYQDLIRQPWPVIYDYSQSMLCYYMTFWLVPAEIAALLGLNETGSNIVLLMWMYVGLILIFFLLCDILKPNKEYVVLITIILLFFSGINMLGMIICNVFIESTPLVSDYPGRTSWSFSSFVINGYHAVYIIRTFYLCLADVYNQFFSIAISTLLFLRFKNSIELYAFVGLMVLPYSPIGFIGVFIVIFLELICDACRIKNFEKCLKKCFSTTNVLAAISLVPVFYFYFSMNFYATALFEQNESLNYGFLYVPLNQYNSARISFLFLYYIFYFGIYALLIYENYKNESVFFISLFCLIVFPIFRIGSGEDFNFNATICPYLLLFVLIAKKLLGAWNGNRQKLKDIVLVCCLSIAMLTPVIQIATSFRSAYLQHSISYKWSPWKPPLSHDSLSDKDSDAFKNFMARYYQERIFYKYLAKQSD